MIEKKPLDDGQSFEVGFAVPLLRTSGNVSVAGDFNGWDTDATPLHPSGEHLVGSVTVDGGRRYAFRYFTDGEWFNDETADAYEPNEFGGYNCVVDLS